MTIYEFGYQLLRVNDLDPVYFLPSALAGEELDRWLVGYWCFYDVGTALTISDLGEAFWDRMYWAHCHGKRGTERRHYRADNSAASIRALRCRYESSLQMVDRLRSCRTFQQVQSVTDNWVGFGPWATFKVADMVERCLGVPIDFSDCELDMYREPRKAAEIVFPGVPLESVVAHLVDVFSENSAPPTYDRRIGFQEVETILCKYKSHLNGHYPIGNDTSHVRASLVENTTRRDVADRMLAILDEATIPC